MIADRVPSSAAHPATGSKTSAARSALAPRLRRRLGHLAADPHVLLATAVAATTLSAEMLSGAAEARSVALLATGYLGLQVGLTRWASPASATGLSIARLALALGFVTIVGLLGGDINARPIGTLYIPVVALAAALGGREAFAIGGAALALYLGPRVIDPVASQAVVELTTVVTGTAIVIAIGTHRTIVSLERAGNRARRAMAEDRRRGRQLAGVEAVGRLLAKSGPTSEALEGLMELLEKRFGYRYPSIYLRDGEIMRLGAQRGYPEPVHEFPSSFGVIGRVVRTGMAAFVPDVSRDPDYVSANDSITCEISVPVTIDDEVAGVLNVESTAARPLDDTDLASVTLIADRLASALALARERESLARRARLFERLTTVAARLSESLEPDAVSDAIADSVAEVIPTDVVAVIVRDGVDGEYRMAAAHGSQGRYVGVRVQPGEGMAGRAMVERRLIVDEHYDRSKFPASLQGVQTVTPMAAVAVPLLHGDDVIGAISLARFDATRRFDALEQEVLPLLAVQAAVAIRNARLMTDVREASIRDPLTGLYNRRHFDASVDRLIASRQRLDPELRRPVSAILFDLDHFGALNKRHGHVAGDSVLRAFAGILRERFRASDIVARFGGEEFIVILDGATRDDAVAAAEGVRASLAGAVFDAPGGVVVRATVSAGCAAMDADTIASGSLLEVADVGLAMAKQAGRDQVVAA